MFEFKCVMNYEVEEKVERIVVECRYKWYLYDVYFKIWLMKGCYVWIMKIFLKLWNVIKEVIISRKFKLIVIMIIFLLWCGYSV